LFEWHVVYDYPHSDSQNKPGWIGFTIIKPVYPVGGDMKFRLIITLSLLALIVLTACTSPTPAVTTEQPAGESQNSPTEAPPAEAYPQTAQQAVAVTEAPQVAPGQALYPEPQSGDSVTWSQAVAMLNNAEVNQIMKSATLELTLSLKDGRSLLTNEPGDGELQIVLDKCGDVCAGIEVTGP
jgi:hypothetical protein